MTERIERTDRPPVTKLTFGTRTCPIPAKPPARYAILAGAEGRYAELGESENDPR
jgi:hypothetical protein